MNSVRRQAASFIMVIYQGHLWVLSTQISTFLQQKIFPRDRHYLIVFAFHWFKPAPFSPSLLPTDCITKTLAAVFINWLLLTKDCDFVVPGGSVGVVTPAQIMSFPVSWLPVIEWQIVLQWSSVHSKVVFKYCWPVLLHEKYQQWSVTPLDKGLLELLNPATNTVIITSYPCYL